MSDNDEDRVTVEVPAREIDDAPKSNLRRVLIWIVVLGVIVLVSGWLLQRPRFDARTAPPSLVGEWISNHPDYSDRYLSVAPDSVTFGIGDTSMVKYSIVGVTEERTEGVDTIVLYIRDVAGDEYQRAVVLDPSGGQMHFASQPQVIWTKD
jgi:hypothetical protein